MRKERAIALGTGLIVLPIPCAVVALLLSLASADLSLVYLSIALSVLAVPAMAGGIVLIVRATSSR